MITSGVVFGDAFAQKIIQDDVTGGDCTLIGTWESSSKTCTLSGNISEDIIGPSVSAGIVILGDGITLDGNDFILTGIDSPQGQGGGVGIIAYGNNVIIKNFSVTGTFSDCIAVYPAWPDYNTPNDNIIKDNSLTCGSRGIYVSDALTTTVQNNVIENHGEDGIVISNSDGGYILQNTVSNNGRYGIQIGNSNGNTIDGNTINNNVNNAIRVYSSDSGNSLTNNSIDGSSSSTTTDGVVLLSGDNTVSSNIISGFTGGNGRGIWIDSDNNQILDNTISSSRIGVAVWSGIKNNVISGNTFNSNSEYALYVSGPTNTISENTVSSSSNNDIVISGSYATGNIVQNNSWSNYDEPNDACYDDNSNGFCDDPYVFSGGQDNTSKCIICESSPPSVPQDGEFVLPCSMQEAGDGVSAGSCHGFYTNERARAEVGINYHSGLLPIENYQAVGYFVDTDGVQGSNISVNHGLINLDGSATLTFENSQTGFVSEFKMQMLGGDLVVDEPDTIPPVIVVPNNMAIEATSNNPSPVTFSVTSTDDTDGPLTPACSHNSGNNFPIGLTTVTCTATDNAGNAKSESFTITVTYNQPSCGAGTVFDENNNSCVLEGTTDPTPEPEPEFKSKVTIIPTPGSGSPGCEETSTGCFIPDTAYVRVGGIVTFSNTDNAAHTFTAGTGGEGNRGDFDSGMIMAGGDFEFFPDDDGEIPYYCMVHPWMEGLLVVGGEPVPQSEPNSSNSGVKLMSISPYEFDIDDKFTISGSVWDDEKTLLVASMKGPHGEKLIKNTVSNSDSSYSFIPIDARQLFNTDGTYSITVFSENQRIEDGRTITLYFDGDEITRSPNSNPPSSSDFELDFETSGMSVLKIEEDDNFISLILTVDVTSSMGILEITFPREYFDSVFDGIDDEFIVLADGNLPNFTETQTNSQSRTLRIDLPLGTEEVEIIGSVFHGNISNDFPNNSQFTVKSHQSLYSNGDNIIISGLIGTLAEYSQSVTIVVVSPIGEITSIMQVIPSTDGTFSTIVKAGGTMIATGTYEIRAQYGSSKITNTFYYSGGDPGTTPTPEPYPELDDEVTIVPAQGSGAPGCEETSSGCFIPSIASVSAGGKVIMKNTDSAAHTFTSGTPGDGPDGRFDTGLLMAGSSFEWSPFSEGTAPYFCMVHPWMEGLILIGTGTNLPPTEPNDDHIDLEIKMEHGVYDINTVAVLDISLSGTNKPQNVAIDVTDPRGTTVISRSSMVDPGMGIAFEFKIDESFKQGNYKVTATTSDENRIVQDNTHFKVKSQFNSFKITSVQVTDQKGNPSNLEAGEIGFIKVNLESNKSIATLMTVNIFDADLTSIGIGSINTTLSSGDSEIILSFNIPDDAEIGSANIYVNAFSDWPSSGGIPLTTEVSIVEDIE